MGAQRPVFTALQATSPTPSLQDEGNLDDTVCRLFDSDYVNFSNITISIILEQFNVDSPATHGNRMMAYFGNTSYRYGSIKHDPQPYPDCPVYDTIFERMHTDVPDFTKSNHKFVCKIPLLERRTRPSARSTIGYIVFNENKNSMKTKIQFHFFIQLQSK